MTATAEFKLIQEGVRNADGVYYEPNGLYVEDDCLPVLWNFSYQERSYGDAFDLRRDDQGYLWVKVNFFEENNPFWKLIKTNKLLEQFELAAYVTNLHCNRWTDEKTRMVCTDVFEGRIRAVSLVPLQGIPGELVEKEDPSDLLRICPECKAGKHGNCNGEAWDDVNDQPIQCECTECDS